MSSHSPSTSQAKPHDLTQGSISAHLYRLTVPMVLALFANFFVQATDMWFISMLGTNELAAMGFAFPIMSLVFSLSIGLSAGVASVVSRFSSSKSEHAIKVLISDALFLCFILGVLIATIGLMTIDEVFTLLGASDQLIIIIRDYIEIFYINNIITMVGMNALSAVRALGDSKAQASSMIAAALVNLILDPIFIFGLGGFPRLELQGAALATSVARLVSLMIVVRIVIFKKHLLLWPNLQWQRLKTSWGLLLHIALPAAATNMIIPLSGTIITAILAGYGNYAVAGMGIAMRIEP
ncbi:MAG: MATE family efflux transporter, partial [Sinobacterium sp.]|nr:MATE family efflux transporter [Sinobacterium sp.]